VKLRCERDTLADAVATAQRAVASRTGAMPVLSGLRVTSTPGTVELVGTDLELTIRVRVPAETEGEGSAVVPARLFSEIVRQLDAGSVSVELTDDEARIEAGRFATKLRTLSATEFPRLAELEGGGVRVEGAAFAEALRQVVPAASRDDARPILTGVLLTASSGGLRLVATDSYRLAMRDLQGVSMLGEGQKVLLFLAAANRDPRKWADPHRFDIRRRSTGHVAFGRGVHMCVGQVLARMEMELVLGALAKRVAAIEPRGAPVWRLNNTLRAIEHLPVELVAR